jgi:hypothetical protein
MCDGSFDFLCASYNDLVANNLAKVYNKQTGLFKTNIDYLLDHVYQPFKALGNCKRVIPNGKAGV